MTTNDTTSEPVFIRGVPGDMLEKGASTDLAAADSAESISAEMIKDELKRVAYHEAGHAVIAMHLGLKVHSIEAYAGWPSTGLVTASGAENLNSQQRALFFTAGMASEVLYATDATIAWADKYSASTKRRLAELLQGGPRPATSSNEVGSDWDQLDPIAAKMDTDTESLFTATKGAAYSVLQARANDVHVLAAELIEHRFILGDRLPQILGGGPPGGPRYKWSDSSLTPT